MANNDFWSKFYKDTDVSGRHVVTSFRTGKQYAVEAIGNVRTSFGDINPATKKVEGDYGDKYRGSIDAKDSLITQENGFNNIVETGPGESPYSAIDKLDAQYPDYKASK